MKRDITKKINKRVLSICLAVMLVVAMAIPASSYTVVMSREYCGIGYSTTDTCNTRSYNCIIEVWDGQTTVRTDVELYQRGSGYQRTIPGTTQVDMAVHSGSVSYDLASIGCNYYLNGNWAAWDQVSAS